jgi:DNA-binding transcriptional MocR family regulator
VYLTTTCHNPTGSNVDAEVRREVARIAVEFGVPLVEDMVLADLSLELPPPPVATFARRSAPIIVVGSLSKVIWGGLRIGWIRAPAPIASRLARLKAVADMGTSAVSQLVALELLPALEDRILDVQRREVRRSLELAEELLGTHTPNWRWTRPKGGRSLWIRLPHGDGQDFARLALSHGVALSAGTTLSFDGSFEPYVRVQFVQPPGLLREGVRRLGMAWEAYSAGMAGGAGSDAVLRES